MLSLTYGCGLGSEDLLQLRPTDIDSRRGLIFIRKGKGRKDRIVPLPKTLLELLRAYSKASPPQSWFFEGQKGGRTLPKSVQIVLKQAVAEMKIRKKLALHGLRHCLATLCRTSIQTSGIFSNYRGLKAVVRQRFIPI